MLKFQIEPLTELNAHAERLLPALYTLASDLESPEYAFLSSKDYASIAKTKRKGATTAIVNVGQAKAMELGKKLRRVYAVAVHFRQFQMFALSALTAVQEQSRDLDFSWNYLYAMPILRLFTNYIRVHYLVARVPNFSVAVQLYYDCCLAVRAIDPSIPLVADVIKERENIRTAENEVQFLGEYLSTFFKLVVPALHTALTNGPSFPWRLLSLIDKSKPSLPGEIFFLPQYLLFMHMNDFIEWFELFCLTFLPLTASDPFYTECFAACQSYTVIVHIYATVTIDPKPAFLAYKKTAKGDLDFSFFEANEGSWPRQKASQSYRRRKLCRIIHEFVSACQVDASVVCTKHGLALSLLGLARFELCNALQLRQARPALEPFIAAEIVHLLSSALNVLVLAQQVVPDFQRFVVYNLREYDCNYLDTLVHSFGIPQDIFDKCAALIGALRAVNIEEFDAGDDYDLYPAISMSGSIAVSLNNYATAKRGITHLASLMQLLAGLNFRLQLYQQTFDVLLKFSGLHELWPYLDQLDYVSTSTDHQKARYNVALLQLCHFLSFAEVAIAEVPKVKDQILKYFAKWEKAQIDVMATWFRAAQEGPPTSKGLAIDTSEDNDTGEGKDPLLVKSKRLKEGDKALNRITGLLLELSHIGIVTIVGEEHNVRDEFRENLRHALRNLFSTAKAHAPLNLKRRLQIARGTFQQICAAADFNFNRAITENVGALAAVSVENPGAIAQNFKQKYLQCGKELLQQCFYSNSQDMFVTCDPAALSPASVSDYLTLPAMHALKSIIGVMGCLSIYQALAALVGTLAKPLVEALGKALKGKASDFESAALFASAGDIIKQVNHISAVLRLREMIRPFSEELQVQPEFDLDVVHGLKEAGVAKLMEDVKFPDLFGSLIACSYWETFEYDASHDAIHDNSHLWGRLLDAFVGTAVSEKKQFAPDLFYRQLFGKFILAINKGKDTVVAKDKKKAYPGLALLIIVDHVVSESRYADYSQLEQLVTYQLIRSLYTAKLSSLTD
jgi:hypothetical protein